MFKPGRAFALAAFVLFALLGLRASTARPQSGHEISGVYEITSAADLGTSERVTLHVYLTSHADADLSVSSLALRPLVPNSRLTETPADLLLRARASSDFTEDFTVSQREYQQWKKGAQPIIFLRLQTQDGSRLTRTIQLAPGLTVRTSPQGGN